MKTRFVIEIETKNEKEFVPEEGMSQEDCTKEEIKEVTQEVLEKFHGGLKYAFEQLVANEHKDEKIIDSDIYESHIKIRDELEEFMFENGDVWENPAETECFGDFAEELIIRVIDEK